MVGTVDNPVKFANPFRRIVEVGWGDRLFAFSIYLDTDPEYAWSGETCGGGPEIPIPLGNLRSSYLTNIDFILRNQNGDYHEARVWRGIATGWDDVDPADVEISGVPSVPSSLSYGSWEVAANAHDNNPATDDSLNTRHPMGQWQEVSGGSLDIPVPAGSSNYFKSAESANFQLVGFTFVGGPSCYDTNIGPAEVFEMLAPSSARMVIPDSAQSISISGVSVTFKGKAYQPIGIATYGQNDWVGDPDIVQIQPGLLWVLCEKVVGA